jgi:hypothetical protein
MTAGKQPFNIKDGQLILSINPALPGWLFKEEGTFTFRFLGNCDVTVHNPSGRDTYEQGMVINRIQLRNNEETIEITGATIKSPYAEMARAGKFDSIDLYYE